MEEFVIPLKPEELLRPAVEDDYRVENEVDPENLSEKQAIKMLEEVESRLLPETAHQIVSHKNFDLLFSFLNKFLLTPQGVRRKLLQVLVSGVGALTSQTQHLLANGSDDMTSDLTIYKNAIKMYSFLLSWFISSAAKAAPATEVKTKGKKGASKKATSAETDENFWESESLKEKVLSALIHVLELDLARVWKLQQPEEAFINLYSRTAAELLEKPANTKSKSVKRCVFIMCAVLIQKYKQSVQFSASLIHLLHNHEHLPEVLAELCEALIKEYESPATVGDIIREIGRMNPREFSQDTSGVKNISAFIGELAERLPAMLLPNVSLLLTHLDGESYTMRNGIIHVIGRLLASSVFAERGETAVNTRDSLLKILEDRFRDVNAFVRSKVIQTWAHLSEKRMIPLKNLAAVTMHTVGRLEDKGSNVRKNAIQLLRTLLEYNPYAPSLNIREFHDQFEEVKKQLEEFVVKRRAGQVNDDEATLAEVEKQRRLYSYLEDAIGFMTQISRAIPTLCRLLGSKVNSDITETIRFFVTATQFKIANAQDGVRKMLPLIWSKDTEIKDAVTEAYEHLLLGGSNAENADSKHAALSLAKKLIGLTKNASLGEITSLEELIAIMMRKQSISALTVQALWEILAAKVPNMDASDSRGALIIISMAAASNPEIIKERMNLLVSIGLGPRWKEDEDLARYTCIALQKLAIHKDKNVQPQRYKSQHPIFAKLLEVIKDSPDAHAKWYPAAEQAINAIYVLHEKPDELCTSLLKDMAATLFPADDDEKEKKTCSAQELSKFFFALGHVALKQLVHIEDIQVELRRRREAAEKEKTEKEKSKEDAKKKKSKIEEELGLTNGVTDELEAERMREIAEKDLVGKNLLGEFGPLLVRVCSDSQYDNPMLRSSAVLALCKFMCVSAEFCERHLPLLFTLAERSKEAAIRANVVIALGDLALRFPNLIEPWTPHLYARLRDKDVRVTKNTLLVLTHLILNDMIKVKGQIFEMALCMEHEEPRISDLARHFFTQFAKKGNNLYNVLPDVISHLSNCQNLSSESFKSIMKYMLQFIEKDRQTEALVEKLCHRFKGNSVVVQQQQAQQQPPPNSNAAAAAAAASEAQPAIPKEAAAMAELQHARDLAFCLTVLNYNDRVVKKLLELFKLYADKLSDEEVFSHFQSVLSKARKFAKQEFRVLIDELGTKLQAAHDNGPVREDGAPAPPPAAPKKKAAAKGGPKGGKKRGGGRGRKAAHSSDEEEEFEDDSGPEMLELSDEEEDAAPKKKAAPAAKAGKPKALAKQKDSDSEEDVPAKKTDKKDDSDEEDEAPKPKGKSKPAPPKKSSAAPTAARSKRGAPAANRKRAQEESEQEEDEEPELPPAKNASSAKKRPVEPPPSDDEKENLKLSDDDAPAAKKKPPARGRQKKAVVHDDDD